ncbi:ABC transporter permease [Microbacterium sp. PA5]|uniref:ABC transporter permease n=1 Tax=Microbacterium sp. PA5 TaxID=3416654 RepID=UPI003CF38CAB
MIGRRVLSGVLVLFGVSILAFSLIQLLPGDTAAAIAGEFATPEQIEAIREELGLNQPVVVQYFSWLLQVLQGDFGTSLATGRPAVSMILEAVPPTLSIAVVSLTISTLVGLGLGLLAALNRGRWADHVLSFLASLSIAAPAFWILLLLILVLAILNPVFPAVGYVPLSAGFWPWLSYILLPAIALSFTHGAEIARYTRGSVIDVLASPYIRAARARGASGAWLSRHHLLRNSAIPIVTVLGLQLGNMLGGVIVVESVAGINGLGRFAVTAVLQRDYIALQAYVLFAAIVIVVVNLIVDILYTVINPKVRS